MSAIDTALRVLDWGIAGAPGAPPEGDLSHAHELADAPRELLSAVGRMAAVTAAKLNLLAPPFGDGSSPGVGSAVLAAAVGGRSWPEQARQLALVAPPPRACYDLITYFGVAALALRMDPTPPLKLTQALFARSPLTALFDAPADQAAEFDCEEVLDRLLTHPDGRRLAALRLAAPPTSDRQLLWRGEVLTRFRLPDTEFVLDVYENALEHFGDWYRARVRDCQTRPDLHHRLAASIQPTATWWRALAEIERARPALLRTRLKLLGYQDGVRLYWQFRRLVVGR